MDDGVRETLSVLDISNIRTLDISYNKIASLETLVPIFRRCYHLRLLNISYNLISNLELDLFQENIQYNSTPTVDLTNNPLPPCSTTGVKQSDSDSGVLNIIMDMKVGQASTLLILVISIQTSTLC